MARGGKLEPVVRVAHSIGEERRAAIGHLDQVNRDQFWIDIAEQWRDIVEKLPRDVLGRRRNISKRRIVFVQKFVIELIINDFAGPAFYFADVNQHSGDRVNAAAKNKIRDVIAAGSVFRPTFFPECRGVFLVAPTRNEQSARG